MENQNQAAPAASKVLAVNAMKAAVIKGSITSIEKNSKGDKVTWLRLTEDQKNDASLICTSKNNAEYAARMELKSADDVLLAADWLRENAGLQNVQDWLNGLFIGVNRPIIATAGASGLEAELICDIESLVAYETLQSARGRKASKFDADMWKAYSPILVNCLKSFFEAKKITNVQPLVNKYLNLIKGAIVGFNPIGDDAAKKASEMIEYTFEWIVVNKPEMESIGAFAVTVIESNLEKYATEDGSGY